MAGPQYIAPVYNPLRVALEGPKPLDFNPLMKVAQMRRQAEQDERQNALFGLQKQKAELEIRRMQEELGYDPAAAYAASQGQVGGQVGGQAPTMGPSVGTPQGQEQIIAMARDNQAKMDAARATQAPPAPQPDGGVAPIQSIGQPYAAPGQAPPQLSDPYANYSGTAPEAPQTQAPPTVEAPPVAKAPGTVPEGISKGEFAPDGRYIPAGEPIPRQSVQPGELGSSPAAKAAEKRLTKYDELTAKAEQKEAEAAAYAASFRKEHKAKAAKLKSEAESLRNAAKFEQQKIIETTKGQVGIVEKATVRFLNNASDRVSEYVKKDASSQEAGLQAMQVLGDIMKNPAIKYTSGPGLAGWMGRAWAKISGDPEYARLDAAGVRYESIVFKYVFDSLRGGGQITEAESRQAKAAFLLAINEDLSPGERERYARIAKYEIARLYKKKADMNNKDVDLLSELGVRGSERYRSTVPEEFKGLKPPGDYWGEDEQAQKLLWLKEKEPTFESKDGKKIRAGADPVKRPSEAMLVNVEDAGEQ